MASSLVQFRTDDTTKVKAMNICERLGIDLPTYMRMCISRLIQENGIPFNRKSPGFYVTCPGCGKVHQKSIMTESIIVCPRCGYEFYSFLKNGVFISFPASQIDNTQFFGQVKLLASALDRLTPVEIGASNKVSRA